MTHPKLKVALLLERVAEEVSLLAETSDDLQITVSEILSNTETAIGSHGVFTLQEIDRVSQTLKALSRVMLKLSETETDSSLYENEVRTSARLDSLADRLVGIVAEVDHDADLFWAGGKL